jgi:hypothetical protein
MFEYYCCKWRRTKEGAAYLETGGEATLLGLCVLPDPFAAFGWGVVVGSASEGGLG